MSATYELLAKGERVQPPQVQVAVRRHIIHNFAGALLATGLGNELVLWDQPHTD